MSMAGWPILPVGPIFYGFARVTYFYAGVNELCKLQIFQLRQSQLLKYTIWTIAKRWVLKSNLSSRSGSLRRMLGRHQFTFKAIWILKIKILLSNFQRGSVNFSVVQKCSEDHEVSYSIHELVSASSVSWIERFPIPVVHRSRASFESFNHIIN